MIKQNLQISIVKAGNGMVRFKGVASTPAKDSDGEYLDVNGFDVTEFLKGGFMNWNHQSNSDPSSIVGRPLSAEVVNNRLEIEFELFDNEKARQIVALQKSLESRGMALGLSIEGVATERDSQNPKIVKRARITGCAITPSPKNKETTMELIKGNSYDLLKSMSVGEGGEKSPLVKESLDKKLVDVESRSEEEGDEEKKDGKSSETTINNKTKNSKMELEKALKVLGLSQEQLDEIKKSDEQREIEALRQRINELEKAEVNTPIANVTDTLPIDLDKLVKGISESLTEKLDIMKSEISDFGKTIEEKDILIEKSNQDIEVLLEEISSLRTDLEQYKNVPQPMKSIVKATQVERFANPTPTGLTEMSVTRDKSVLAKSLADAIVGDKLSKSYSKDVIAFNTAGAVTEGLKKAANELGFTLVR